MRGNLVERIPGGKVWLVGAGPGSADLLTLRAARLLAAADVVAYDELVSPEVLALARRDAELVPVGRRAGPRPCRHHDARIHPVVVARALEGKSVVRLKGGDPYVFGRGGEEAEELAAAGVPFEVVPGISAALAAAAATHVPLTHRDVTSHVTLATGHSAAGTLPSNLPRTGTLALYMGLGGLETTLAALIAAGRAEDTPAMAVSRASHPDERVVIGTLATLASRVRHADLATPALVIVGDVIAHRVESPTAPMRATPHRAAPPPPAASRSLSVK